VGFSNKIGDFEKCMSRDRLPSTAVTALKPELLLIQEIEKDRR